MAQPGSTSTLPFQIALMLLLRSRRCVQQYTHGTRASITIGSKMSKVLEGKPLVDYDNKQLTAHTIEIVATQLL